MFILVVGVPFIVIGKTIKLSYTILTLLDSPFFKNVLTFSQKIKIIFFKILRAFFVVWFHDILEDRVTKRIIVKDNEIIFKPFNKGNIIPVSSIRIASKYPQFIEKVHIELGQPNLTAAVQMMMDLVELVYSTINWGGGNMVNKHYIQFFKLNDGILHFNLISSVKNDPPKKKKSILPKTLLLNLW